MIRFIFSILVSFLTCELALAASVSQPISTGVSPTYGLFANQRSWGLIEILSAIEAFLLRVALPLTIIGSAIYIAYELFLADGNEEKNKRAWKSLTFAIIGVLCIALAYAAVAIVSRLSL